MTAVLGLIQELADFEKEPDAVLITVDDLVRDGFGPSPLFHVFVAEVAEIIELLCTIIATLPGKTIHLEDLVVKEKKRGTGAGYALYSEIIKQGKRSGAWNGMS
jgi:GNAT superfamily N-acetyltransferase